VISNAAAFPFAGVIEPNLGVPALHANRYENFVIVSRLRPHLALSRISRLIKNPLISLCGIKPLKVVAWPLSKRAARAG